MNKWEIIAKLKILKDIGISYLALYTYFTIFLIYFEIMLPLWFSISAFVLCIIATIIDYFYIFPQQQKVIFDFGLNRKEKRQ